MGCIKKSLLISFICGSIVLNVGCEEATETTKKVTKDVSEAVQAEVTKDNQFVVLVKEGSLINYPNIKIESAFANFFSSPKWKYFKAENGENVVEFTGYCTYVEKKVKAKLQFLVVEGSEHFDIGALEFNDVPQNELTKIALIAAIYDEKNSEEELDTSTSNEVTDKTDVSNTAEDINLPFQIGSTLSELTADYGDPSYDDYYMGGRLVVFNDEDGYFLDESEIVNGFMIANPDISIYGTHIGMTPHEISAILSEPNDSYFDETESQSFINEYSVGNYNISFSSEEENGPTASAVILVK